MNSRSLVYSSHCNKFDVKMTRAALVATPIIDRAYSIYSQMPIEEHLSGKGRLVREQSFHASTLISIRSMSIARAGASGKAVLNNTTYPNITTHSI